MPKNWRNISRTRLNSRDLNYRHKHCKSERTMPRFRANLLSPKLHSKLRSPLLTTHSNKKTCLPLAPFLMRKKQRLNNNIKIISRVTKKLLKPLPRNTTWLWMIWQKSSKSIKRNSVKTNHLIELWATLPNPKNQRP